MVTTALSANRYPASCRLCGVHVAAQEGILVREGGRNSVVCHRHPSAARAAVDLRQADYRGAAGPSPVRQATIRLELVGREVSVRPVGHLGGELFEDYRAAASGAVYRASERASFAPLSRIAEISRRLADAGFAVDASDGVRAAAAREADRQVADASAATERAERVAARLSDQGLALMQFQAEGVSWLAPRSGAILADEMGLGKTIQVLAAIPSDGGAGTVVVCPKVAKGVWAREASRWRPDLRVSPLQGRGSFRWPESPDEVVVLNYEILPGDDARVALLESCPEGVTLVADEGHALKAGSGKRGSARGRSFRELADRVRDRGGRAWVVTGSPVLNRPPELWSLLTMVGQQAAVFGGYKRFVRLMGGREGQYGTLWTGAVDPSVPDLLRRATLRREKRDVLAQMPAKVVDVVDVDVDAKSRRELDRLQAELEAKGVVVDLAGAAEESRAGIYEHHGRDSVAFEDMSRACEALARAKVMAALEIVSELEEIGEPVVVFSAHRAPVDALGTREGWATITGDTSDEDRTAIAARFQAGELRGIAGTIQAMGVAVTLTRACEMLVVSPSWVPELNAQAEDRIHRIGQERPARVRYLRADHPLDWRIFEVIRVKRALVAASVGASAVSEGGVGPAASADLSGLDARPSVDAAAATTDRDAALDDLLRELADARARGDVAKIRRASLDRATRAVASRGLAIRVEDAGDARDPVGPTEIWAAIAIAQLAGCDPDRASEANGVGFNKADGALGHALAASLRVGLGLTELEWGVAIAICRRYPRQVGRPADPGSAPE